MNTLRPKFYRAARRLTPLFAALTLFGCLTSDESTESSVVTVRGNITQADLANYESVAYIIVGDQWHYFAIPEQMETAITAVDADRQVAYGWSRTTPESNDKGFMLDLRTNTFTTIQIPGVDRTIIRGADQQGRVVGLANVRATSDSYGFIYDPANGQVTEIRRPGHTQGAVTDLNQAGTLVGYNDFGGVGYVHQNGIFTTLTATNAGRLFPMEINEVGTIVGLWGDTGSWWDVSRGFIATPSGSGYVSQSYRVANHPTTLNGINDSGLMAGTYYPAGIDGLPRVFSIASPTATPRTHPSPVTYLQPWVDGIDNKGRIFGHATIDHTAADPTECGGHGHLHGTACHCDTGYKQDPEDEGMCIAN
jgi:hypothetical protein